MIGVSSLGSMYYPEAELSILLLMYKDKECPERINWKQFEDEINTGILKHYKLYYLFQVNFRINFLCLHM